MMRARSGPAYALIVCASRIEGRGDEELQRLRLRARSVSLLAIRWRNSRIRRDLPDACLADDGDQLTPTCADALPRCAGA